MYLTVDSLNTIWEAVMMYEIVRDHIRNGGLPIQHKEYTQIKQFHQKSMMKTQEDNKLVKDMKFYKVNGCNIYICTFMKHMITTRSYYLKHEFFRTLNIRYFVIYVKVMITKVL